MLSLKERAPNEEYAKIAGVVRDLASLYGLRVIIDSSPNSLDPTVLGTGRCLELQVEPMSDEKIATVEEFKQAREWLREADLEITAVELFGGSPMEWENFVDWIVKGKFSILSADERREIMKKYLYVAYRTTKKTYQDETDRHPNAGAIADLFFKNDEVLSRDAFISSGLQRPERDKVFRLTIANEIHCIEPATRAMFYYLKYGREQTLTFNQIKQYTIEEHNRRYNK